MGEVPKSTVVPKHVAEFTPESCRALFRYFEQHATETAPVSDLGAYISAQHRSDEDETDIAIALHQATLRKSADAGLIE